MAISVTMPLTRFTCLVLGVFLGCSNADRHPVVVVADGREGNNALRSLESDLDMECYEALYDADVDGDRRVSHDEYATFIELLHPDFVVDDTSSLPPFEQVPLDLQGNFLTLACSCQRSSDDSTWWQNNLEDCCVGDNAHIPNYGMAPNETPNDEQASELFLACWMTRMSMQRAWPTTPSPTQSPTQSPTLSPNMLATVSYTILVRNGLAEDTPQSAYTPDLIGAMDGLSVDVAQQVSTPTERQLRILVSRTLEEVLEVQLPTAIDSIQDVATDNNNDDSPNTSESNSDNLTTNPCFSTGIGNPETDRCEQISALVELRMVEPPNDTVNQSNNPVENDYEMALQMAIDDGQLQDYLMAINPDSVVVVLSEAEVPREPPSDNDGLSGGATTGIVVGSAVAVLALVSLLFLSGRTSEDDDEEAETAHAAVGGSKPGTTNANEYLELVESNDSGVWEDEVAEEDHVPENAGSVTENVPYFQTLQSASHEELSPKNNAAAIFRQPDRQGSEQDIAYNVPGHEDASPTHPAIRLCDSHSTDGKSKESTVSSGGWSSGQYTSSMDSEDDFLDTERGLGTAVTPSSLSWFNAGTALTQTPAVKAPEGKTLDELEAAITVGDWAAVGASAAVLAGMNSGSSATTTSGQETLSTMSSGHKTENGADLNQMIEQGDWEAVMRAAVQNKAVSNRQASPLAPSQVTNLPESTSLKTPSSSSSGSRSTASSGIQYLANLTSRSRSSSPCSSRSAQSRSKEEIRADVMELVARVVPQEMGTVDEMLREFRGREEDLLETLRTMEQRNEAMAVVT